MPSGVIGPVRADMDDRTALQESRSRRGDKVAAGAGRIGDLDFIDRAGGEGDVAITTVSVPMELPGAIVAPEEGDDGRADRTGAPPSRAPPST